APEIVRKRRLCRTKARRRLEPTGHEYTLGAPARACAAGCRPLSISYRTTSFAPVAWFSARVAVGHVPGALQRADELGEIPSVHVQPNAAAVPLVVLPDADDDP